MPPSQDIKPFTMTQDERIREEIVTILNPGINAGNIVNMVDEGVLNAIVELIQFRAISFANYINDNCLYSEAGLWYKSSSPEWGVQTDRELYLQFLHNRTHDAGNQNTRTH